jgi:hypothetical protein
VYNVTVATADYSKLLNNGVNFCAVLMPDVITVSLCIKFKYVNDIYLLGNFRGLKTGSSNSLFIAI